MTKTLTSAAEAQRLLKSVEPLWLIEIDWLGNGYASGVGRFSDRNISVDGTSYLGYVMAWADLDCSLELEGMGAFNDLKLTMKADHRERFADYCADYVPEGKCIRFGLWFGGTEASDITWMFEGVINEVSGHTLDGTTLEISEVSILWDRPLPRNALSIDDFADAHPDDVGKALPIVFGAVDRLPCLRAAVGGSTKLNGSVTLTATTISVDDTTDFPSTGTLLIEDEQVTYTGKSDTSFTGCTRGTGGTDAAEHLHRRDVVELLSTYIFFVADHACKSITNVRVAGQPTTSGVTIEKNNTALLGRSIAVVKFSGRPKSRQYEEGSLFLEMFPDELGTGDNSIDGENAYDDPDAVTYARINESNTPLEVKQTTDMSDGGDVYGEIITVLLCVEFFTQEALSSDSLTIEVDGETDPFTLYNVEFGEDPVDEEAVRDRVFGHSTDLSSDHTHAITEPNGGSGHAHTDADVYQSMYFDTTDHNNGNWSNPEYARDGLFNLSQYAERTGAMYPSWAEFKISKTLSVGGSGAVADARIYVMYRGDCYFLKITSSLGASATYVPDDPDTWVQEHFMEPNIEDFDDLQNLEITISYQGGAGDFCRVVEVWVGFRAESQTAYAPSGVTTEDPASSKLPKSVVNMFDISDVVGKDWSWFQNKEILVKYVGTSDDLTARIYHVWFEVEFSPFTEEVSDEVTVDVEGVEDAGDGTGTLIVNPSDVIKEIITHSNMLALTEGSVIDSTSFAAAKSSLEAISARFDFALTEARSAMDLLVELAEQARSWLALEAGKFYLRYRPDSLGSPVRDLIPRNRVEAGTIKTRGLGNIINLLRAVYDWDYQAGGYRDTKEADDATSQTTYGVRPREAELWALRDATYAQTLTNFLCAQGKDMREVYTAATRHEFCDIERGDVIDVADLDWNLVHRLGEVIGIKTIPGAVDPAAHDTYIFDLLLEAGYELYWNGYGGNFIRLYDSQLFFVVQRELVARLTSDGILYIKGFVVGDQALPASSENPLEYDSDREAIGFALSNNTRVMELDNDGNILLPIQEMTDQELSFAGTQDAIESDGSKVWFNIGSTRAAEVTAAGLLKLPKYVVENCTWEDLYG